MSFFTSFQDLLEFDHSTNLNGFHFSNSLFGFDSNSVPALENLPPPPALDPSALVTTNSRASLKTPSPIPEPPLLLETPKHYQFVQPLQPHSQSLQQQSTTPQHQQQHHHQQQQQQQQQQKQPQQLTPQPQQQASPAPIVSKFQLKVTPNNEIYISNESGTFCELAGSFVPSQRPQPRPILQTPPPIVETIPAPAKHLVNHFQTVLCNSPSPEPPVPKTLFYIEKGIKRPLSPSDHRYSNSGIFRSSSVGASPLKKKSTSTTNSDGLCNGGGGGVAGTDDSQPAAKLVVSTVINNGLIVNKKHLSTSEEQSAIPITPERRIMRTKKRKKKPAQKVLLAAKVEPLNGRIVARVAPEPIKPLGVTTIRKLSTEPGVAGKRFTTAGATMNNLKGNCFTSVASQVNLSPGGAVAVMENALNFSGIKEKAAQEAIFVERNEKIAAASLKSEAVQPPVHKESNLRVIDSTEIGLVPGETVSSPPPVELKVVADLVMDKNVFGHVSLLNNTHDRGKTVIYQNPVTSTNVIYSILNPKSLNLSLAGTGRGTSATLTLQPHRGSRKPKKRGRKKKVLPEAGPNADGTINGQNTTAVNAELSKPLDPDIPVSVTRSGRLSKPPRYANNYFQNIKQKTEHSPPPPPPLPPPVTRLELPAPDPETAEKLPNFSAALSSTVNPSMAGSALSVTPLSGADAKRKMKVPLQYRCSTCNKVFLGKRMQTHLQKYPSHNSERDCVGTERKKKAEKEEKSTYLYKHLFDLLQKFTENDKGRIMLKEISNFVDFVRALIPKLITNEEQNSTVEYIDHNVADVLRLNHGKYRLKLSSLAEEYKKLNHTVSLLNNNNPTDSGNNISNGISAHNGTTPLVTSTPNGHVDRQSFSFNADELLNQSSSFPSLSTLVNEHNLLLHSNNNNNIINNNNNIAVNHHQHNNNHYLPQQNGHHGGGAVLYNHHHHLPLINSSCHDDAMNSLSGLCKSPVQHSASGMVNMALNLY
ncbi:uncharacterized protein LOC128738442 [Sabethes cyaneus]|uniref:uncharacterized protein LOC128738442 n=1 Tax=Sabethes cyaneus TaxID=53552 RepID=UPI00237E4483|nr:uncharacterized protein LOC128738442 [Sabethes cyaneus]